MKDTTKHLARPGSGLVFIWMLTTGFAAAPAAVTSSPSVAIQQNTPTEITGTLRVLQVCGSSGQGSERYYEVIDEKAGQTHRLSFDVLPAAGHVTGERVRIRGDHFSGGFRVRPASAKMLDGIEVLEPAKPRTNGLITIPKPAKYLRNSSGRDQPVMAERIYDGGATTNTVVRQTLVVLINFTNLVRWGAADILNFSNNLFFGTSDLTVNTAYLENSYGAVGFAGKVIVCNIAADANNCNDSDWTSKANVQAIAQGENPGSYAHQMYIAPICGACGVAEVGGSWAMCNCTDKNTLCHELGHNLGFNHASSQWGNTSAWDDYGDDSDFMGGSGAFHNNGPHKLQKGWVTAQTVTNGGIYQIGPIEHVPGTIPYPQLLTIPSSSPPNGWPYFLSYKQNIGFDAYMNSADTIGVSIHRYNNAGGNTAIISLPSDGGTFTDATSGLVVKQLSHDTNSVTVAIVLQKQVAQPYTILLTSEQIAAQMPVLVDVVGNTWTDPLTITNFDAITANGGTVTLTNNQLWYTPPSVFTGNDTFSYSAVDVLGTISSATVTVMQLTQPHYNWDVNGATAGIGGSGTWNTSSFTWDSGTNVWPGSGTSNWALLGGTAGTVSIAAGGISANGLVFKTPGYVLQNNTLMLNGTAPTIFIEGRANATVSSVVAGTAGLTKSGSGTLTLNNANTYSGGTVVSMGNLQLNTYNAASSGTITVGDTNTGVNSAQLTIGNNVDGSVNPVTNNIVFPNQGSGTSVFAIIDSTGGQFSAPPGIGSITLNRNVTFDMTGLSSSYYLFYHKLVGAGTLTYKGVGRFICFNDASNYTGDIVVSQGIFEPRGSLTAANGNNVTISNGGIFRVQFAPASIGGLYGNGTVDCTAGTGTTLTVGKGNASGVFLGAVNNQGVPLTLVKTGTGTQQLNGAGVYGGGTRVSQGTLIVGIAGGAGSDPIILGDANTGTNDVTLGINSLSLANSIVATNQGTGKTTLAYTFSAGGTVYNGGAITLNKPTTFTFPNLTDYLQFSSTVSGNGDWIITNTAAASGGRLVLNTGIPYSGNIAVQNNVNFDPRNYLTNNPNVTVEAGGHMWVIFGTTTINALNGNGPVDTAGVTLPGTLIVGNANGSGNYGGVMSGSSSALFSFTKAGTGTQILSGVNTYTGPTTVGGGKLEVDSPGSLASGSAVTVNPGGTLGGTGTINGPTTIQSGGTLAAGAASVLGTLTLNGTLNLNAGSTNFLRISKTGGVTTNDMVKKTTGTLTYAGVLVVTNITSDSNVLTNGDTFTLFQAPAYGGSFAGFVLPSLPVGLSWNTSQLTVNGKISVANGIATPVFNPPAGGYVGTQLVSISSATPGTTIYYTTDGSTPTTSSPAYSTPITVPVNSTTTINAYATLSGYPDSAVASATYVTMATAVWTNLAGGSFVNGVNWSNNIVGQGRGVTDNFNLLTLTASRTVTLDSSPTVGTMIFGDVGNAYDWTLNPGSPAGTLTLDAATPPVIQVNNRTTTIAATMAGTNGLVKAGAGQLTLSGSSSGLSGSTVVSAGTLQLNTVFAGNSAITLNDANTASNNTTININNTSVLNPIAVANQGSGTATINFLSSIANYVGIITLNRATTVTGAGAPSYPQPALVTAGGGTLTFNVPTASGTALILDPGASSTYSGINFTGDVVISNGTVLEVRDYFKASTGNSVTVNGTLQMRQSDNGQSDTVATIGGLNGSGNVQSRLGTYALTVGKGGASGAFSGVIQNGSGTAKLVKTGAGTQTLSGANSYTGSTTVNGGMLLVNGSLASGSSVMVNASGTLGGTGTVNGPVTVGGTMSPGASVGTLTTGAETWNGGGRYVCQINATNTSGADKLNISGSLNVQATSGSPFIVKLTSLDSENNPGLVPNFNKHANHSWTIATASGGVLNFAANKFTLDTTSFSNNIVGGSFTLTQSGNNLLLNYVAAPVVPSQFTWLTRMMDGTMQLGGTGVVGEVYTLLAATNLAAPVVWVPIATNTATNGAFQFADPQATNYQQRFYRNVAP